MVKLSNKTGFRFYWLKNIVYGLLIFSLILCTGGVSADDVCMLDDVRVTYAAGISQYSSIAVDSNNNVHIAWHDYRDGNYEIYYKKYDNNGNNLTGSIRVTNAPDNSWYPSIAADSNNNVHIAWHDYRNIGNREIYYKKYDNNGNNLTGSIRVTNAPDNSWYPSIAADSNNNVHIAWHDNRNTGNREIYYKKYDNNGNNLTGDIRVTNVAGDSGYPSIAVDSNNSVHISWQDNRGGTREIYYKKYDNNGNNLTGDIKVTNVASNPQYPSIAADSNNNIHIAWYRGGDNEIYYKKYDNNGNNLTGYIRVTNALQTSTNPSIAAGSDNNIHIVWQDDRDGGYEIYYKKYDNNGNNLTWSIRVTNDSDSSEYPSIAVDSNNDVHVAWDDDRIAGNYEIYYNKLYSCYKVINLPSGLSAVLTSNDSVNVSSVNQAGVRNVSIRNSTINATICEAEIDFTGSDPDFSNVRIEHGTLNGHGYGICHLPAETRKVPGSYKVLYVPVVMDIGITCVDSDANTTTGIQDLLNNDCAGGEFVNPAKVDMGGADYYKINSVLTNEVLGTGGVEQGNARLNISDDTAVITKYANQIIQFYANYTNVTSNESITPAQGGQCNITFNGTTWYPMQFNATGTGVYNYSASFASCGTYTYNISCGAVNFNSLNTNDTVVVSCTAQTHAVPAFNEIGILILIMSGAILLLSFRKEMESGKGN